MRNRVVHFFGNVSMTNGHNGLQELARGKVALDDLKPGEFVAFVNTSFTSMKLMAGHGVLLYWKQESSKKLFTEVISTLPHFLVGTDIGFSREVVAAMLRFYKKQLARKQDVKQQLSAA